jgi:deazaflavin-dependent oxidoreductase (nitroreductase family)
MNELFPASHYVKRKAAIKRLTRLDFFAMIVRKQFGKRCGDKAMPEPSKSSYIQYLYLTTTGRITGQPREIEIWFVSSEGKLYILAEHFHKAQWVKNIERNPRVRVRVGEREFEATARALDRERDAVRWEAAQQLAREKYGWGEGLPVEIVTDEPL